jgi:hypothetical protein
VATHPLNFMFRAESLPQSTRHGYELVLDEKYGPITL